ncbi:MAG: thiamine pyrophosphate-binding protein [Proteobacteria bacterium]|jgi:indolepyruvate decarboxylase|nr:thiamine pyrophosphate-binding protein [Pseudomonadota bacterium]
MSSVSDFLVERMENAGVKHVFGLPGDHITNFFKKLSKSDVEVVHTTQEINAAFAADAYARIRGVGCVCVSQMSALKIANAIACAKAEHSPVIVISGAKSQGQCQESYHNKVFQYLTCASTTLNNVSTAGYQIDSVLEKLKYHKQPVFIELAEDIADKTLVYDVYKQGTPSAPESNKEILEEALAEVVDWLNEAKKPVILGGIQLDRHGLGALLLKFAEKYNIPVVTTLLSKSLIDESHPLAIGVYAGAGSNPKVQETIDTSDCLLVLGVSSCQNLPANKHTVTCSSELCIKNHFYADKVGFEDFIRALFKASIRREGLATVIAAPINKEFRPRSGVKITVARFFEKINSILNANSIIVSDVGDSLFGASDLITHQHGFFATAYYPSMGFALPAALGLQTAVPKMRPIVILGDAAFQMSCSELSTIVARRLNPIVCVLNNGGYASNSITGPFYDIHEWDYEKMVDVISGGMGALVEDEQTLHSVMSAALVNESVCVINVKIDSDDVSPVLQRMRKGIKTSK